ncbi:MAG: glycosyl hydrolase, partial [Candidatus Latescibacterota bacterium]
MNLKEFVNPSRQYRPAPFWSWNDVMEPSEIENRIRDMKRKGFGGFFMHARQGLRTKYLSDDWMRAIRRGVETARELEIEAWLYDEDRWPSGFAGEKTTEGHDEYLALALTWTEDASVLEPDILERAVAFTRKGEDGRTQLLRERPGDLSGAGVFYERRSTRGGARYNGEGYPDLLNPDTVREFLDNTYERYSKLFRYDFGKYMPGIFTDEPNVNRTVKLRPSDDQTPWSFPWTPGFAEYFEKIHGYSPLDQLHYLLDSSPEGFKFRHDFWRTVSERFVESYSVLLAGWCKERELLFTGHYLFEDDFRRMILSGGSVMAHYEYMDVPGIDHLGRCIGDPWTVKQAASVANQLGKKRVVSELFGASGQDLTLEDMKWIADYNLALGVTFLCPHLVQFSLKGDGKRDFPPTISDHQPYWEQFRVMNDYLARASWAVSRGKSAAETLVLHPVGSAYGALDMGAEDGGRELQTVETSFRDLVGELLAEHIDFDLGDERILIAHGKSEGGRLTVGEMRYRAVALPYALTWLSSTLDLLDSFTGPIILVGEAPGRVSGAPNDRIRAFAQKPNVV